MIRAAIFQEYFERYKQLTLIVLLVIFYTVGIVGLAIPEYKEYFLSLSFFNLTLSFALLILGRHEFNTKLWVYLLFGFSIGMAVEWIGVHTGYLFGDYYYGENLGLKWYGVPLVIGVNWLMLTIISSSVAKLVKVNKYIQAFFGALLMLLLDLLIEPFAIVSDYWYWAGEIPVSNFVTWFIIALFLQFFWFHFNLAEKNKVAITLYILQLLFFIILNSV
jgi:putative membrane protein